MPKRLSSLEVAMLDLDSFRTPAQVGTVNILDGSASTLDYQRLLKLVGERLCYVPRYRQRVRSLPLRLAGPVWVDDDAFEVGYHVRRAALPRPGTAEQLHELVSRVMARRLDRSRPLWEMYFVEGLADRRVALVTKTHLCLVDGVDAVDLAQVLLDSGQDAGSGRQAPSVWRPASPPTTAELLTGALWQAVLDPDLAVQNVRGVVAGAVSIAQAVGDTLNAVGRPLAELAENFLPGGRPAVPSFAGTVSEERRTAAVAVPLSDLRAVAAHHDLTVHDVVLGVVSGGLRAWLATRGESVSDASVTALVPMSVTEDGREPTSLGSAVTSHLQELPIGGPDALLRLQQIAAGTRVHRDTGRAVGARVLSELAGFAPPTLHVLGVRASTEILSAPYDVLVSNVPGPQVPLYAAGARLLASYPILPLSPGHLLAVGVTSYLGEVHFGLTGDRDGLSDLEVLAQCLTKAVAELLDTTGQEHGVRRSAVKAARREASRRKTGSAARRGTGPRVRSRGAATQARSVRARSVRARTGGHRGQAATGRDGTQLGSFHGDAD